MYSNRITTAGRYNLLTADIQKSEANFNRLTAQLSSGTKIASVKVDNETTDLYAPSAEHNYSSTEQIVGKWIDGTTDVYEKTIEFNNVSKDGSVSLGITSVNMIFMENGLYYSGETYTPIPYVHGTAALNQGGFFQIEEDTSATWNIRCGSDAPSTVSGFITFRYTKVNS